MAETEQTMDGFMNPQTWIQPTDDFLHRHLGPTNADIQEMLATLGLQSLEKLADTAVPPDIRHRQALDLPHGGGEQAILAKLKHIASQNKVYRSLIGMGYYDCVTPGVIQRNILENPAWYTQYTPYQAEISQGRLEALIGFQQMLIDLTGLPVANASLLDEATAAAEAMGLLQRATASAGKAFFADARCHPQVLAVMRTRARWLGLALEVGDPARDLDPARIFGAHLQYPGTDGRLEDWSGLIARVQAAGGMVSLGVDPLALVLLKSPGALGADVAVGSAQRFGVPLGYGGPQGTGGYWYYVARELVVFAHPPREFTLAVLNHEAFHQYIFYFYGQLSPHSWYNEGTGDYYAGAKLTKSNRITGFGDAPGGIGRMQDIKEGARLLGEGKKASQGAAAPLKSLLKFHQSDYYGSAGYDPGLCYAEGWAVVHFLREGKSLDPKWQRILPDYLTALLQAREAEAKEAMEKAIKAAEELEAGSGADLPHDVKEWYTKVDVEKVQDRAYETTFKDWSDADWEAFQAAWLKYVEKL